jgi:chromosomal replication initiator protein
MRRTSRRLKTRSLPAPRAVDLTHSIDLHSSVSIDVDRSSPDPIMPETFAHLRSTGFPPTIPHPVPSSDRSEPRAMSTEDKDKNRETWQRVRARLRTQLGEEIFKSWFAAMEHCALEGDTVRVSVPTSFLKSWVQSHYADKLLACWKAELPSVRRIEVVRRTAVLRDATIKAKPAEPVEAARETKNGVAERIDARAATLPAQAAHEALGGSPLDPRLTFDTFVVGRSNTLAHAAGKQVALARRGEAVMFNPIYIHAGVGLGKTHLLQSVAWAGNAVVERKVLYLTAEKFMYGFVAALKAQTALAFKEALRGIDVLVIDDLQFLQGKSTQVEFCHTLNALIDAGRQVVIAADRPPGDLESLDDRVRSRLAGGLVVEMGALEEELRLEILKSRVAAARAHHAGFDVPAPVLGFIAKSITHNGRDLDGALNRLLAHNKLTGHPVTMDMAERAVRDLIRPQEPKRVKIEDIQRVVARQYNVSRADLLSSRRTANVVRPRQIAMYLAKTLTLRSLPEIGRRFGGRDHTTVLHAVRKIEGLVDNDTMLAEEIDLLKRLLQE